MKANELMIGDWVQEDGFAQIVEDLSPRDGINGYGEDRYSPIPLTEEILKANGFKHQLSMNNVDHGWNLGDLWLTKDLELFVYKIHVKLSYIHELQHILRLCGFNELADNFKLKAIGK